MAVEHPFSGRGNEGDVDAFLRENQNCVRKMDWELSFRRAEHLEAVAMQVDRMRMRGRILQTETIAFARRESRKRRGQVPMSVIRPGPFVDSPKGTIGGA